MDGELKRTSIDLPLRVWQRTKLRAIQDGTDFKDVVVRALINYLGPEPPGSSKRGKGPTYGEMFPEVNQFFPPESKKKGGKP